METPGAYEDDLVFNAAFLLDRAFFWTALPRSGGLSPGVGWDAVT